MRGSTLVSAIRVDADKYPNVCRMILYLYDGKDREHIGENAVYAEDLFANNAEEKVRFIKSLDKLEANTPAFMGVQITESHVVLFHKTPLAQIFARNEQPGSYMH